MARFWNNLHQVPSNVYLKIGGYGYGVFDATFNTISVISWWSVVLVVETGDNH